MSTSHQSGPDRPDGPLRPGLSPAAASVLAGTLEVLCRGDRLSTSEIGDHIDVVAELTDALASLTDRLAHDLRIGEPPAGAEVVAVDLEVVRDGLARASVTARRCADGLYRAHLGGGLPPRPAAP